MRWMVTLFFVLALGLMGCSEASGTDNWAPLDYESNPHAAKYDFSEVDSASADFVERWANVDGITLAVVRENEGQIYEAAYGEFERDRVSLLASTTKVLSVGIILTLVDQGLLEIDRPIVEYLDWGEHHPTVTVEDLLSMMSGIGKLPSEEAQEGLCSFDPSTTSETCAREIFQDESDSIPPGQEFRYSESAWTLAGGVAQVVSGESWAELVEKRLVGPCGLPDTQYFGGAILPEYPEGFAPEDVPPSENPSIGGGAASTVNDYSKVLLMHLHEGICGNKRVLSPEMIRAMQRDMVPDGVAMPDWNIEASNYGMGWWKHVDKPGLLIDSGAFGARAVLHPEEGWGAILIIESRSFVGSFLVREIVPLIRSAVLEADDSL